MAKDPEYRRRFSSPPVVPPCQGFSPTALLNHLVLHAAEFGDFKKDSVVVERRSCRDAIRVIAGLLSVFLQELRDHGGRVGDSVVVACLAELHVAFQKLRRLLHECSRRGGRVWVLMRSERVADEFRSALRSVATAVDLLVVMLMDGGVAEMPTEAMEYGRLAAKQALSTAGIVGVDPADDRAAKDVLQILGDFEKGVRPDREIVTRVFGYLGISSWSECDEEVSFLEEEIGVMSSGGKGGGIMPLLSSLMALMVYSRSVIFDTIDGKDDGGGYGGGVSRGNNELDCLNPEELRCPISLELMKDPVTICTGQTYERGSIVRWLKSGNGTCPVTGKRLTTTTFVPNLALKSVIQKFCHSKNITLSSPADHRRSTDKTSSHLPGSLAAAEAMRMLAVFLARELSAGSNEERTKALHETRLVAKTSGFHRLCLVEAGCVPWLLHFLASWDPLIQENSMAAILNLVKHTEGRKVVFESGGLVHILDVLAHGLNVNAQQNAAVALFYLSSIDEYRQAIGEAPGAIPALVRMLKSETSRGKMIAMTALFGLLLFPGNHRRVLDANAIPNLVDILSSRKEDLASDSLSVLNSIAERPDGSNAILHLTSSIPSLVEILRSSTSVSAKEQCVSILLSLFNNGGGKVLINLQQFPHLMPSLYSLLTERSPRAAKRISSLVSILLRGRSNDQQGNASPDSPVFTLL